MSINEENLVDIELASQIQAYIDENKLKLKLPTNTDKVYKDECVYCFDTPFSQDGLYICCSQFVGLCSKHLDQYVKKTGNHVFLNIFKKKKIQKESEEPRDKIQRLCIKEEKIEIVDSYSICLYPNIASKFPIDNSYLSNQLVQLCDSIVAHASADLQNRLQSGISEWDGEERIIPPGIEDLMQLDCDTPIQNEVWQCMEPGCDLIENLWLNLSDGSIKCGRYAPLSGIKGNSHAKAHYEKTGFPYVVKLGTIENCDADLYSYADDAPIRDPYLRQHLAHFGLDIDSLKKTEKTTLEIELDANMKYEYSSIQEDGAKLQNKYGPGFTGLINLGSSCYINSVLQALLVVPDIVTVYDKGAEHVFSSIEPQNSYEDFNFQLAKLVRCMSSGLYSHEVEDENAGAVNGIRPTQFRRIVGQGHVEFSTARQQDAEEYVRHLFDKIDRNVRGDVNPVNSFRFYMVTRFMDAASYKVRYTTREEFILSLPIPMELSQEVETQTEGLRRRKIGLDRCLEKLFGDEFIEGYVSPITNEAHGAFQTLRMKSFPEFLFIQLQRFAHTETYEVKKLDIDVEMDQKIDLNQYISQGIQPGEELLPEGNEPDQKSSKLMDLGFTQFQAKYALDKTQGDVNQAAEWLFMNVDQIPPEPEPLDDAIDQSGDLAPKNIKNGPGSYELCGFISHMGSSPHSGHYVAHIKKEGVWYIFNDEKVAISQNPPIKLGYLYLYKRCYPSS